MPRTNTQAKQSRGRTTWALAAVGLRDAYTDFMLSRQAMNCTPFTLAFYRYTAGKFLEWIERQGITSPDEVTARYVREYIAELVSLGRADTTVWDHARAIKQIQNNMRYEAVIEQLANMFRAIAAIILQVKTA